MEGALVLELGINGTHIRQSVYGILFKWFWFVRLHVVHHFLLQKSIA